MWGGSLATVDFFKMENPAQDKEYISSVCVHIHMHACVYICVWDLLDSLPDMVQVEYLRVWLVVAYGLQSMKEARRNWYYYE